MPIEIVLAKLSYILAPVLLLIWFFLSIRRKQWLLLSLGIAAIAFAALLMMLAWQHATYYERDSIFQIASSASKALDNSDAEAVRSAFSRFADRRSDDYYEARNELWRTLHELGSNTENGQPTNALDSELAVPSAATRSE